MDFFNLGSMRVIVHIHTWFDCNKEQHRIFTLWPLMIQYWKSPTSVVYLKMQWSRKRSSWGGHGHPTFLPLRSHLLFTFEITPTWMTISLFYNLSRPSWLKPCPINIAHTWDAHQYRSPIPILTCPHMRCKISTSMSWALGHLIFQIQPCSGHQTQRCLTPTLGSHPQSVWEFCIAGHDPIQSPELESSSNLISHKVLKVTNTKD